MLWFEIYTDPLIMSVLVTSHVEEITLFIEWYFQLCQKIIISVFACSLVYFYTSPKGMSLWQIRYIWLPRLVDLISIQFNLFHFPKNPLQGHCHIYCMFMLHSVSMNFVFSLAVDYSMPASIIFTLLWSSHHNKCKI